ncbi:MAG TPA: hypothetical protein VGZ47_05490, partial [Gemmataceae bacterium]|nr:hypothetical protein [Gemmataceae bacterium]
VETMPISMICPGCGGSIKAPDHAAGKTGKCPKCGLAVQIPAMAGPIASADYAVSAPEDDEFAAAPPYPGRGDAKPQVLGFVVGKPVSSWATAMVPATFGKTTLQLLETRVIERTRRPIVQRDCGMLLSEVDSGEIVTHGNALLIALAIPTFFLFGLGILFFILYFFMKHRFLVIRSQSNAVLVALKGDVGPYQQFLDAVLSAAEAAKARN